MRLVSVCTRQQGEGVGCHVSSIRQGEMSELYQALDIHHNISTNLTQSHGDDNKYGVKGDADDD